LAHIPFFGVCVKMSAQNKAFFLPGAHRSNLHCTADAKSSPVSPPVRPRASASAELPPPPPPPAPSSSDVAPGCCCCCCWRCAVANACGRAMRNGGRTPGQAATWQRTRPDSSAHAKKTGAKQNGQTRKNGRETKRSNKTDLLRQARDEHPDGLKPKLKKKAGLRRISDFGFRVHSKRTVAVGRRGPS
jgi:hypothetical protein